MATINETLLRLSGSKFRASFKLTKSEREYIAEKGMEVIRRHAGDFVRMKIADAYPKNDGRQTPMHGHPAFKAMHACACCCRGCIEKWYRIPQGRALTENEQERIVRLLVAWIEKNR